MYLYARNSAQNVDVACKNGMRFDEVFTVHPSQGEDLQMMHLARTGCFLMRVSVLQAAALIMFELWLCM